MIRKLIAVAAIAGSFLAVLHHEVKAQGATGPYQFRSAGYCQMTTALSSSVVVATANCSTGSVPSQVTLMQICVSAAAVRYRDDGSAATASIGMPVGAGTCFTYNGDPRGLQFIRQAAGAVVDILFYN